MNNSPILDTEYEEIMTSHHIDKFIKDYTSDINLLLSSLQKELVISDFTLEYKENSFIVSFDSSYDEEYLRQKLYTLISIAKKPMSHKFIYHHETEVLEMIKFEKMI